LEAANTTSANSRELLIWEGKHYQCSWYQITEIRTKMQHFHAQRPTNVCRIYANCSYRESGMKQGLATNTFLQQEVSVWNMKTQGIMRGDT